MGDVFKEQLVKRQPSTKDYILKTLIGLGFIAVTAALIYVSQNLGFVLVPVLLFMFFNPYGRFNIEYEYVFTNGDLDIDCIANKSKRRNVLSVDVRSVELMTRIGNGDYSGTFAKAQVTRDFSGGKGKENTFIFLVQYEGKKTKVIFEPNEKMLAAIKIYMDKKRIITI